MTFDLAFLREMLPALVGGLRFTLELWALTLVFGGVLGILIAVARVYGRSPIYYASTIYVEIIRGTPLLVQLFILYYGLPQLGIVLPGFIAAVIAFSINTAAYQAEYFRGAIQSVRGGQMEAAEALGMTKVQIIRRIVLPQAMHMVIHPWSNEAIVMLKATSLAFMVTVPELMFVGRIIAARTYRNLEVFITVAVLYIIVVLFFTQFLDWVEKKTVIPGLGGGKRA